MAADPVTSLMHTLSSQAQAPGRSGAAEEGVHLLLHTLSVELEEHKGLTLESHLYGCLSLWEQWAEGVLEIEEGVVKEEGETPLDLRTTADWESIGQVFGFTDSVPPYTGSEAYRAAWLAVFLNPVEWRSLGRVDAVEGPLFERLGALGAVYMQAALPTGELPTDWVPPTTERTTEATEATDEEGEGGAEKGNEQGNEKGEEEARVETAAPSHSGRRRYKHTRRTHGRRSLSPVQHHNRRFGITRRRKVGQVLAISGAGKEGLGGV